MRQVCVRLSVYVRRDLARNVAALAPKRGGVASRRSPGTRRRGRRTAERTLERRRDDEIAFPPRRIQLESSMFTSPPITTRPQNGVSDDDVVDSTVRRLSLSLSLSVFLSLSLSFPGPVRANCERCGMTRRFVRAIVYARQHGSSHRSHVAAILRGFKPPGYLTPDRFACASRARRATCIRIRAARFCDTAASARAATLAPPRAKHVTVPVDNILAYLIDQVIRADNILTYLIDGET